MGQSEWLDLAVRAVEALVPLFGKVGGVIYYDTGGLIGKKFEENGKPVELVPHFEVQVFWCRDAEGKDVGGHYLTLVDAGGPGGPAKYAALVEALLEERGLVLPEAEN